MMRCEYRKVIGHLSLLWQLSRVGAAHVSFCFVWGLKEQLDEGPSLAEKGPAQT